VVTTSIALCLGLVGPAGDLRAWGEVGHRAAAELAEQRLKPDGRAVAIELLGGQTLADVAVWADEVRSTTHRHTDRWHSVNIPIDAPGYRAARDCRLPGECVLAALPRLEAQLRDRTRSREDRREALMFLVHFIADMHQPLHVADRGDRGGNETSMAPVGGTDDLHRAWDDGIIQAGGHTAASLVTAANRWLRRRQESRIGSGRYDDWAREGLWISRLVVYPQAADHNLTPPERRVAIATIEERIARAGVRLAAVLNRVF
jgi:hypothetical protein